MNKGKAFALIEADIKLVPVQNIEGAVLIERGVRNDKIRRWTERDRVLNSSPIHAEIACLTNVQISISRVCSIGRFGPIKFAIGAESAMTPRLVAREISIWNSGVPGVIRCVG